MTSNLLSPLVEELGKLQVNKILRGDYDLKIARQDYFISKQDQVVNLKLVLFTAIVEIKFSPLKQHVHDCNCLVYN